MNERVVIGPKDSLIKTIVDLISEDTNDFSRVALVFPGKRPAHFIRKELAVGLRSGYIPPVIFSIDDFIYSLYRQLCSESEKNLEKMDAVALLHRVHTGLDERLGGEYFTALDEFLPVGMKLYSELEELHIAHLPEKIIKEQLSTLTHNRLYSLQAYYKQFYALVKESGYSTRAMRYVCVSDRIRDINVDQYDKIIISMPFRQTNSEKIIFQEIEKNDKVRMVYQFDKPGGNESGPEINLIKAADTHGQVFALTSYIDRQIKNGKTPDVKSVVVLPEPASLFAVYHQSLSLIDENQYNIALGYPFIRTPIFGFLNNLLELVSAKQNGVFPASLYIRFILHPYTKNISLNQRADITRILFHTMEEKISADTAKKFLTLEDIESRDEVFTKAAFVLNEYESVITPEQLKQHVYTIHNSTVRAFDSIASISDFAGKCIELISYIYEASTARLHPMFRRYAEAMIEVFQGLENSIIAGTSFRDIQGYLTFFRQYVGAQDVPFPGTPLRGLQVLGLLETRGLQFDDVCILDVNEDVLPGSETNDMLLPQELRKRLGLETLSDRDTLMEYYFNLLVHGARQVTLFYNDAGDRTRSRFIEKLLWEEEKRENRCSVQERIKAVHCRLDLTNDTVKPMEKSEQVIAVLRGFSFSASMLDMYLRCPLRFYYTYVLKLDEKEETSDDVDARDIGQFVHLVLNNYYAQLIDSRLQASDFDIRRMEELIERLFEEKFGVVTAGTTFLLKHQIQTRLKDFLTEYQKQVIEKEPVIIRALEKDLTSPVEGIKCTGRIDRIEERNGIHVIMDYKTGINQRKNPVRFDKLDFNDRSTWEDAIQSLQLPLYLMLYKNAVNLPLEQIRPVYLYLGETTITIKSEVPLYENLNDQINDFNKIEKLFSLLFKEILDPEVPFQPPQDLNKTCRNCPMQPVCGTTWIR
ncbi:MAG: PD-(D/E)XK nuclease family protein [Bacteroidetes bacterium]|nr:PD-(D/E)XK nuclease family protein [Bacteroidota bacterium]